MAKIIKLPPVQNVGANQTAVLPQVPHGMTYDAVVGEMSGTTITKALITGIRARLNGKQFIDVEGSHLDVQNQYKKMTANAAYFSLNFAERNARTIIGEGIGAIDTSSGVDTFDFEFDFGAISADASLNLFAIISPPKPIQIGGVTNPNKRTISAVLKKTHSLSGAADHAVTVPIGSKLGGLIKRVHFHHGGNQTALEVRRDGNYLQQVGNNGLVRFIQNELNRTAQTNHEVFDPCYTDNQSDAITTLREDGSPASFEYSLTTSATDTVVSYTELYTQIARL